MAPKMPSRRLPVASSSRSHTSAVIDIISVNRPPMPNEKKGSANMNIHGLPGTIRNHSST
jgi:hypothetical protein